MSVPLFDQTQSQDREDYEERVMAREQAEREQERFGELTAIEAVVRAAWQQRIGDFPLYEGSEPAYAVFLAGFIDGLTYAAAESRRQSERIKGGTASE